MDMNDAPQEVIRVLYCYEKHGDRPVAEYRLDGIDLERLRAAFRPPSDDPLMYGSYLAGADQAGLFEPVIGKPLDLDRYDYFVECHASGG
jgi:hypothetical protein